jgi:hypothetical protein
MSTTPRAARILERVAIGVASIGLAVLLIVLLSGYFVSHDPAGIAAGRSQAGRTFADQGDALLAPGAPAPRYDSSPPTSGAHRYAPVRRELARLSDAQLLTALSAGDVVVLYGTPQPPPGLQALARSLAAPFTPQLAAAGEAVILAPRAGTRGLIALAWTHMVRVGAPRDPALGQFINARLGHGALTAR